MRFPSETAKREGRGRKPQTKVESNKGRACVRGTKRNANIKFDNARSILVHSCCIPSSPLPVSPHFPNPRLLLGSLPRGTRRAPLDATRNRMTRETTAKTRAASLGKWRVAVNTACLSSWPIQRRPRNFAKIQFPRNVARDERLLSPDCTRARVFNNCMLS